MKTTPLFQTQRSSRSAMTLVELLAVIAILALLISLTIPSITSITQGREMQKAITGISDRLDAARAEAMAKSTWVWVGFRNTTQDNAAKDPGIVVAAVASRDGSKSLAASNLSQIDKPLRIQNVKVLDTKTSWAVENGTVPLAGNPGSFTLFISGANRAFSGTIVGFSPQGEATLGANEVPSWIEIGLREMRGGKEVPTKTASIRVSGVSGQQIVDY